MNRPNFFIVGAPKCGTTAINNYLQQHPDVFMAKKELHFFGSDLPVKERISEAAYLAHFDGASGARVIGDASVWYLYSQKAGTEIHSFAPGARILIMLREPVEMLYSLHSQHLYDGNENVAAFEKAIHLDAIRKQGKHLSRSSEFIATPYYFDSVAYSAQVARYFTVFPRQQVHVIIYEHFRANPAKEFLKLLEFLGLEPLIPAELAVVNPNKQLHAPLVQHLLKSPPGTLRRLAKTIFPSKRVRHHLMAFLFSKNVGYKKREPMSPSLRAELREVVAPEVEQLERLLEIDLSIWKR